MCCKTAKKERIYHSATGIILFSDLNINYFFPLYKDEKILSFDYDKNKYSTGFLLTGLNPETKINLIKDHSDLVKSNEHPFTHITPVKLEYSYSNYFQESELDSIEFEINNNTQTFYFDSKHRNLKQVIPLK